MGIAAATAASATATATSAGAVRVTRERVVADRTGKLFVAQVTCRAGRQNQMPNLRLVLDNPQIHVVGNFHSKFTQHVGRILNEPLPEIVVGPGSGDESPPLFFPVA